MIIDNSTMPSLGMTPPLDGSNRLPDNKEMGKEENKRTVKAGYSLLAKGENSCCTPNNPCCSTTDYIETTNTAGFEQVSIIEETSFATNFAPTECTIHALANDLAISGANFEKPTSSIRSEQPRQGDRTHD